MAIRTGFFIRDSWTGITGRVLVLPASKSGDFVVLTRSGKQANVQGFNAEILSYIQPQIGDILNITNGAQNFTGRVIAKLDNGEYEMELFGLAGSVSVHPSQMYQLVAQAQPMAAAS